MNGNGNHQESMEAALWLMVITQAFSDAAMNIRPGRENTADPIDRESMTAQMKINYWEREDAREWLLHNSPDFQEVCNLALLDPDAVRDRARAESRKNWPGERTVLQLIPHLKSRRDGSRKSQAGHPPAELL